MLENAVLYAHIILLALPFNVLQLLFQSFCVTAEKPRLGLTVTVMSGVTNMVMDAVLVMLLPQEYKLAGAAAATALSETVGGLVPLIYFGRENDSILRLGRCSFDGKAILKACTNGFSEFMSNISMSLVGDAVQHTAHQVRGGGRCRASAFLRCPSCSWATPYMAPASSRR